VPQVDHGLAALKDANTALSRHGHQRESLSRLQQIEASADRSATLMCQRYGAGAFSLIDLLDMQRTQFSAQQNLVEGRADLLKSFVSLQKVVSCLAGLKHAKATCSACTSLAWSSLLPSFF
jgi:outer membrane protein TolC